ncbi:unnamed protein product [Rhodiola kirilowii]
MVFVHTVLAGSNKVPQLVENNIEHKLLSNKRKLIDNYFGEEDQGFKKLKTVPSLHSGSSLDNSSTGSQLETPLPLDWQRCLDIQSGKVHLYNNTKSETRTSRDPREGTSSRRQSHMSLDLELNLPYNVSPEPDQPNQLRADLDIVDHDTQCYDLLLHFGIKKDTENKMNNPAAASSSSAVPSWLAFEGDEKSDMVATVCKRCFMLVMLCKVSPTCPNCKFMHSPDQSVPYLSLQKDLHRPTSVLNSQLPATSYLLKSHLPSQF